MAGLHGVGDRSHTFGMVAGTLPPGLTLHIEGLLDGTPTVIGRFPFVLALTCASPTATTVTGTFTITVEPPLVLGRSSFVIGHVGEVF